MLQQPSKSPRFETNRTGTDVRTIVGTSVPSPQPDASAGAASITYAEALLLAAWRENDLDMLAALVNSRTGATGLKLYWHDPLIEVEDSE